MTEAEAKAHLVAMLQYFTPGSVLHLLGELFEADAEAARQEGDNQTAEQCRSVAAALFVVGLGVDAARPRP